MKIHLATSGGFANLRLEGELDTAELAPELAAKAEAMLVSEELERAAAAKVDPRVADAQAIELTVRREGEEGARRYRLDEAALGDELLDVLDALRHELVRQKARALGREPRP